MRSRRELRDSQQAAASISLVLPAFNEQETLEQAIREADDALAQITDDYEIIVVDDGSTDQTYAIATEQALQRERVRVLRQPGNVGYGAALRRGFAASRKDLVAFTDADCQFDIRELQRLVMLADDYDVVCGYRIERQDKWNRKFVSWAYNCLVRSLLGTGVRDTDCALKLFHRGVVNGIGHEDDGFFINAEILARARISGYSLVEVGVTHRPRPRGTSTVSWHHVLPVLTSILRFLWNVSLFPAQAKPESSGSGNRWMSWAAAALLLLVSLVLFLPRLSYPLIEPDETRYAQVALEMCQSGDWLRPTLDGVPYLDKPPLLYWMTAASYSLFGPSPTSARLPPAICAVLTVMLLFVLGKRLVGSRAAWLGSLALLLSGGFVLSGRFLIMDGPLTLFATVTALTAYLACSGRQVRIGWLLVAGLTCGLGVLAKGPIAAVLCVPPLLAVQWLSRNLTTIRLRHWSLFALSIALVAGPWFVAAMATQHGYGAHFFWQHNVVRFLHAFNHRQASWFYLPVLLIVMFPASSLLVPLGPFICSRSASMRNARSEELGFLLLSAGWIIVFFSLSSCKLPTYILPTLPLLCLLIGAMLDRFVCVDGANQKLRLMLNAVPSRVGVLLSIALVTALVMKFRMANQLSAIDVVFLVVAGLLITALYSISKLHTHRRWAVAAILSLLATTYVMSDLLPMLAGQRSIHLAAARVRRENAGVPIVYFEYPTHGTKVQAEPIETSAYREDDLESIVERVGSLTTAVLVTEPRLVDRLQAALGPTHHVIPAGGRHRVYLVKATQPHFQSLTKNSPPPRSAETIDSPDPLIFCPLPLSSLSRVSGVIR